MGTPIDVVVISGGAESAAVSVVEACLRAGFGTSAIAMRRNSLLRAFRGLVRLDVLEHAAPDVLADMLLQRLEMLAGPRGLAVVPTEDDGLFLLNRLHGRLPRNVRFARARALAMGGLDKAELFAALLRAGLAELVAPTVELSRPDDFPSACAQLGADCIVKPAYKPWRASLGPAGLKVICRRGATEPDASVVRRLAAVWGLCPRWIAQQRLHPFDGCERSVGVLRGAGRFAGVEVRERLKHPRDGGTAVWVESSQSSELFGIAETVAAAIDLEGIAELSFLRDARGAPRLLELNTRPWLQVELVERSGFPIVAESVRVLHGGSPSLSHPEVTVHHWLQPERWLMAALTGDRSAALRGMREFLRVPADRRIWSTWSSRSRGIRLRWLWSMLSRAMR